jgi:type II secretory pathway pseudopilin PulG
LLLPILVVECNRVISIYKPQAQSGVGAQGYGGTTSDNQTLLVSGVPCSILQGTKGEKSETNLAGDTRSPWWSILMPKSVGYVAPDDIIIDDLGQRYIVSSNETSDLGYRATAMMALS